MALVFIPVLERLAKLLAHLVKNSNGPGNNLTEMWAIEADLLLQGYPAVKLVANSRFIRYLHEAYFQSLFSIHFLYSIARLCVTRTVSDKRRRVI
ncbi:hypothetical protein PSAC2689_80255 [Paraburkholderia sacchari]